MNGLLVRVGIDATDGAWNAPVRSATREFVFVTITENPDRLPRPGLVRLYDEFVPKVTPFGVCLPPALLRTSTHLDPDFDFLTYGDRGARGTRIAGLKPGDFLAFFAGLRPVDCAPKPLVYALIGIYVIDEMLPAASIPAERWHENAHTRRTPSPEEIVIRARRGVSGRLKQCIPIGEYRNRSYRVRRDLLKTWGDLDIKDGFIQRSVRLPAFRDGERFYRWFPDQEPELLASNNPQPCARAYSSSSSRRRRGQRQ